MLRGKRSFYLEQSYVQNGLVACSLFTGFYAVCMFFCRHQTMLSGPYDNPAGLAFCMSVPLAYEIERMHQSQGRQRWLLMGGISMDRTCDYSDPFANRSRNSVVIIPVECMEVSLGERKANYIGDTYHRRCRMHVSVVDSKVRLYLRSFVYYGTNT